MMYINITYNGEGVDTFFTQSGKRRVDPEVPNCQYCETAMAFLHCSKSPLTKQYQQLVAELAIGNINTQDCSISHLLHSLLFT